MLENPIIREMQPKPYEPFILYRPSIRCSCGCKREIVDGWEWEGDFFYDDACVIKYMKDNAILKAVEL